MMPAYGGGLSFNQAAVAVEGFTEEAKLECREMLTGSRERRVTAHFVQAFTERLFGFERVIMPAPGLEVSTEPPL